MGFLTPSWAAGTRASAQTGQLALRGSPRLRGVAPVPVGLALPGGFPGAAGPLWTETKGAADSDVPSRSRSPTMGLQLCGETLGKLTQVAGKQLPQEDSSEIISQSLDLRKKRGSRILTERWIELFQAN